jgi:uncharacterized protein (TIGR03083 family)
MYWFSPAEGDGPAGSGPNPARLNPVSDGGKFLRMSEELFARTAANRLLAADLFASLGDEQWTTPSLCAGWSIRDLAGHLLMPLELSYASFFWVFLRERGSFDRTADRASRRLGRRPTAEIVATLRAKADVRMAPPGVGPAGPFTDSCVHLRDAARPLGSALSPPSADWRTALDFLVSRRARRGFVPAGRLTGLRLETDDQDWESGGGALLTGPSEALALALAGRPAALPDLSGRGAAVLAARIGGPTAG